MPAFSGNPILLQHAVVPWDERRGHAYQAHPISLRPLYLFNCFRDQRKNNFPYVLHIAVCCSVARSMKLGCSERIQSFVKDRPLSHLQHEFWLSLRWVPTTENGIADAITIPSREEIVGPTAQAFQRLWGDSGEFTVDLMLSTQSAQVTPGGTRLPFFSTYHCQDSAGVDVFAQDVAFVPGSRTRAFGFGFPSPVMVGPVLQHLAECSARKVVVVPDTRPFWYPLLAQAATKYIALSARGQRGALVWPHHPDGLREYVYDKWCMKAYEVDFAGRTTHGREK